MEIQEAWSIVKKMLPTSSNSFEEAAFHTLDAMITSDKEKGNMISVLNQVVGMVTAVRDVLNEETIGIQKNSDQSAPALPALEEVKDAYCKYWLSQHTRVPESAYNAIAWCYDYMCGKL
jgi:hypothetical protein